MIKGFLVFLLSYIFTLGVGLSGMLDPTKVQNFFDITGTWDPSLMFVMFGALLVVWILFPLIIRNGKTLFKEELDLPTRTAITPRLVIGSIVYGVGMSIVGICAGPSIAILPVDGMFLIVFDIFMLSGMFAVEVLVNRR